MKPICSIAGISLLTVAMISAPLAAAGTLSPRLQALVDAYAKAPQAVLARSVAIPGVPTLAPRVTAAGQVEVYIHYRPSEAPSLAALADLEVKDVEVSPALGVVQAWVPIARLQDAADLDGVVRVGLPAYAYLKEARSLVAKPGKSAAIPPGLHIDNEGIAGLNVQPLLDGGTDGSGLRVGVISIGDGGLSDSQNAGYLPNNVWVAPGLSGSGAEGTAMLEEVHAMAPGATLGFCGPGTTVDFVTCLDDLDSEFNADVIVDDLGFPDSFIFNQPDGDAFMSAVGDFIAAHQQINLVTAAGNEAQDYFEDVYIADTNPNRISLTPNYTPGPGQAGGRHYQSAMDFGFASHDAHDATETILIAPASLAPGIALNAILTWDDPANGPYDDVDLFLVKVNGTVVASSTYDQTQGPNPDLGDGEYIYYQNKTGANQTLYLAALCFQCAHPILIKLTGLLDGAGSFRYVTHRGVFGQAGLAGELTVGAAQFLGDTSGIQANMEPFSDSGPYTYGDWQSGTLETPKPDLVGIDGVTVSGAGGFSSPFFGTSAAAPNVASVIALLRSAFPDGASNAAGWVQVLKSNTDLGAIINTYDPNIIGAGLVDAAAAAVSLDGGPITARITAPDGSPVNPDTDVTFTAVCEYGGPLALGYHWSFGRNSGIPSSSKLNPDPVQYDNGGFYTVTFTCSDAVQSKSFFLDMEVEAAATADDLSFSTDRNQQLMGQLTGKGIGGD
ncbi:MAG: S8 family serine peptidase [Gammaproteobacteria bacterium]